MSHDKNRNFYNNKELREPKPVNKEVDEAVNTAPIVEAEEFSLTKEEAQEVESEFMTPPEVDDDAATIFGEVNCDRLRIRKEPSLDSDVLGILNLGSVVAIVEETNPEFDKIIIPVDQVKELNEDVEFGYCMKEFLTVIK